MNKRGLSAMQDAILFVLMVSISGAILLPAFTHDVIKESYVEREKDEVAAEALVVLLSMTKDEFSYTLGEEAMNTILKDESVASIFKGDWGKDISKWLAGRTQYHKCYGELIAECLTSQLMIPWNGKFKANFLTYGFSEKLKENISRELKIILGDEYDFNFTARWHPVIGLPFGGEIFVGHPPPENAYVAKTFITIPYVPEINGQIIAPEYLKEKLKRSAYFKNICDLLDALPDREEEWTEFENELVENVTNLFFSLLFNKTYGVIKMALDMIFKNIEDMLKGFIEKAERELEEIYGGIIQNVAHIILRSLAEKIIEKIFPDEPLEENENIVDGLMDRISRYIEEGIRYGLREALSPIRELFENMVRDFVHYIIEMIKGGLEKVNEIVEKILDWTIERIRITKAEVRLSIWEV